MNRRKLLDLYSCEGGAARGYDRAGFDVYVVDLFKHYSPNGNLVGFSRDRNPYPAYEGDAILALTLLLAGETLPFVALDGTVEYLGLSDFSAIHASPPCQHASAGTRALRGKGKPYPKLIEPTRYLLELTGLPYVIENVTGSALRTPVTLCGSMFDLGTTDEDGEVLRLERHRLFESNVAIYPPTACNHDAKIQVAGVYGGGRTRKPGQSAADHRHECRTVRRGGYVPADLDVRQRLLGIDWMTNGGMAQSLPPTYTEWIGELLSVFLDAVEKFEEVAS